MKIKGIYCYIDKKTNKIVYVGKDSHISNNMRHTQHLWPSNYNAQIINRVLQNNPDRYEYEVLKSGNFKENLLNALEILYIRRYQPKFNFTVGGEGATGRKWTEEQKRKQSERMKGENHPFYGKKLPKKSIQKMIETKQRNFKYKVGGKKIYFIRGRNGSNLISSLDKNYLEDFIPLLNSNEESGLKAIEEAKFAYKYEIVKLGFNSDGKQIYGLKRNGKIIKTSINRAEIFSAYSKYLH